MNKYVVCCLVNKHEYIEVDAVSMDEAEMLAKKEIDEETEFDLVEIDHVRKQNSDGTYTWSFR